MRDVGCLLLPTAMFSNQPGHNQVRRNLGREENLSSAEMGCFRPVIVNSRFQCHATPNSDQLHLVQGNEFLPLLVHGHRVFAVFSACCSAFF